MKTDLHRTTADLQAQAIIKTLTKFKFPREAQIEFLEVYTNYYAKLLRDEIDKEKSYD
jgi:hypothetical protein